VIDELPTVAELVAKIVDEAEQTLARLEKGTETRMDKGEV